MANLIGTDYTPPDLLAKFTGTARYAEDFRREGMLFAKLLLSPRPHGRVTSLDTSEAEAMEGVMGILTANELPNYAAEDDADNRIAPPANGLREYALTNEPVYEGQPILALAAVDEVTAAAAIETIKITFEGLPFVLDPLQSLSPGGPNAQMVKFDGGMVSGNRRAPRGRNAASIAEIKWTQAEVDAFQSAGPVPEGALGEFEAEWTQGDVDIEAAFAEAEVIIEEPLYHQNVSHHPMEPRTCMAYWENGKLFIHPSTQSVAQSVNGIARAVGIDSSDVVLLNEYTGGGFGSKIAGTINMAIPALLAKKTGRPVMHRVTRYEENYIGRARPGYQMRAKMGWRKDGRLIALDMFIVQDSGPYGASDLRTSGDIASLCYQPLSQRHRTIAIYTNTPPRAAQRGPGGAQIIALLEPLIDKAARKLDIDRLEIRRINAPSMDSKFGSRQSGLTSVRAKEAFAKMDELINWKEMSQLSGRRQGTKVTGVGLALSAYTAGSNGYDGLMIIRPDGILEIHTGAGNLGTHSYSDTARAAADVLNFPWEKVEMVWGDTSRGLPWTTIQAGSMTTYATTRANHAGATDAKQKLQEIAAQDLGGSPEDYEVGGERVYRTENPETGMTFAAAAQRAIDLGGKFSGQEVADNLNRMTKAAAAQLAGRGLMGAAKDTYPRSGGVYSFVVGFCRVEVDVETGVVSVLDYAATTDCGTVMNPRGLAAQLHGGGVQGMGIARSQKWLYDQKWGVPFAHRFYTARPPGILDVPLEMKAAFVDIADPFTPVGCKGIGEPPVGAGAGALICAIQDALQDALGDGSFNRTPILTEMIVNALENTPEPYPALAAHV